MKKNILVTGGSGFIGRNIIEILGSKYNIFSPRHKELDLIDENAVKSFFDTNSIDVIIHCALKPGHRNAKDPTNLLNSNLRMFFNLVRSMAKNQKLINIGSGSEYDMRNYVPKVKEEQFDAYVPADEGGYSKYVIAKYIEESKNIVNLRVFGVFGKYEDYAIRFISNAICKTLYDIPVSIKQNRKFDYIYINDLVNVIEYFIDNTSKYRSYNVTPDNAVSLYEIAQKVVEISNKKLEIKIAKQGMGLEYSGDNARLKSEIANLKFTPIIDSIKELYKWYTENINIINKENLLLDK